MHPFIYLPQINAPFSPGFTLNTSNLFTVQRSSFPYCLNGWANESHKRLKIVAQFQGSSIRWAGDNINLSFFPKMLLHFPAFPAAVENKYSQFSRKMFNPFEKCLRIIMKAFVFYTKVSAWTKVAAQLSLNFPGENVSPWKTIKNTKTLNISDTSEQIFIRYSPKWLHCVWPSNFL